MPAPVNLVNTASSSVQAFYPLVCLSTTNCNKGLGRWMPAANANNALGYRAQVLYLRQRNRPVNNLTVTGGPITVRFPLCRSIIAWMVRERQSRASLSPARSGDQITRLTKAAIVCESSNHYEASFKSTNDTLKTPSSRRLGARLGALAVVAASCVGPPRRFKETLTQIEQHPSRTNLPSAGCLFAAQLADRRALLYGPLGR